MPSKGDLICSAEVCRIGDFTRQFLNTLIKKKRIPRPHRIKRRLYWERAVIEAWAAERKPRVDAWRRKIAAKILAEQSRTQSADNVQ
jgi:predicted DNA-binding transcriptional regulator AlpA